MEYYLSKKIFADNQREKDSGRTRRLKEKEYDEKTCCVFYWVRKNKMMLVSKEEEARRVRQSTKQTIFQE